MPASRGRTDVRPRFISLFSGLGSADHGFEQAGLRCAAQVEIDPACQAVLRHWWPAVPLYGDITKVRGADLPEAEVVVWGSPCQNLSVAGNRAGLAGAESGLFFEGLRVIREMREASDGRFPTISVWENVPGAYSSDDGRDFGAVLDGLAGIGAVDLAWRVVNCEHWAPQRRRRVFVVACFPPVADGHPTAGGGRAAEILTLTESVRRNPGPGRAAGQGASGAVAGSLGGGSGARGYADDTDRMTFIPTVSYGLNAKGGTGRQDGESETFLTVAYTVHGEYSTAMVGNGDAQVAFETQVARNLDTTGDYATSQGGTVLAFQERGREGGPNLEMQEGIAYALTSPHGGGRRQEMNVAVPLAVNWQAGATVEMSLSETTVPSLIVQQTPAVAQPLRSNRWGGSDSHGDEGTVIPAGMGVRRLTPLEASRLQSLPDTWLEEPQHKGKPLSDGVRYRMLGNAMNAAVMRWIGQRLAAALADAGPSGPGSL